MQLLSALIALQVLVATILLNTSADSKQALLFRHTVKQVLGASIIADDTVPTPIDQSVSTGGSDTTTPTPDSSQQTDTSTTTIDQQITPPPQDSVTPIPGDSSLQSPDQNAQVTQTPLQDNTENTQSSNTTINQDTSSQNINANNSASSSPNLQDQIQTSPTSNPDQSLLQIVTPTETASAEPTITEEQITPTAQATDTGNNPGNSLDTSVSDTAMPNAVSSNLLSSPTTLTIVNPDSVIANPQEIDTEVVHTTQQQDQVLQQPHTQQQEENTLLSFAKNSVITINNSLGHDDLSTTSYLTQRLNDQIDKSEQNLEKSPPSRYNSERQALRTFCKQADLALKTEQLSVPEDMEEDVIIARAKCLAVQP